MNRLISFIRTLMFVILAALILIGFGQVKTIAKAAGWEFKWNDNYLLKYESEQERTAKLIDDYLWEKNSPMAGTGEKFVMVANKFNIPVFLMVGIAGAESSFGTAGYAIGSYNAVGLGVHEGRRYANWEEGIDDLGFVLRNYYFDEGRDTPGEIQAKWAPRGVDGNGWEDSWAENVLCFIEELEGRKERIS